MNDVSVSRPAPAVIILLVAAGLIPFLLRWLTPYMAGAFFAYACLLAGLASRKRNRDWHARLMGLGISIDLSIVLALQIQRNAIQTAISFRLSPLQQLHIAFSSAAVLLYLPTVTLGLIRYFGGSKTERVKVLHLRFGIAAFCFRTVGLLLMLSMLK